jgi:hypothetical protein
VGRQLSSRRGLRNFLKILCGCHHTPPGAPASASSDLTSTGATAVRSVNRRSTGPARRPTWPVRRNTFALFVRYRASSHTSSAAHDSLASSFLNCRPGLPLPRPLGSGRSLKCTRIACISGSCEVVSVSSPAR